MFHVGLCVENMTRSTTHHHREGKSAIVTRAAPFLGFAHSKDLEARSFTASRVARRLRGGSEASRRVRKNKVCKYL